MEEVETKHGVLPDCYDERKGWRREIKCFPVFNWRERKGYIRYNRMGQESRSSEEPNRRRWHYGGEDLQKIWRILPVKDKSSGGKKKILLEESAWW